MSGKEDKQPVASESVQVESKSDGTGGKCCCCPCRHGVKGKSKGQFMEYHERRCTNLLCLLIYIAFMLAWAAVWGLAFTYGTPDMYVFLVICCCTVPMCIIISYSFYYVFVYLIFPLCSVFFFFFFI